MPRTLSDEAIVLRTFDVGEADRFCILLTKSFGRIAARAQGVRKLLSRRRGGLLPFQRISVLLDIRSSGYHITGAVSLEAASFSQSDPGPFASAAEGMELVLRLTEEGEPLSEVFALCSAFLRSCRQQALHREFLAVFTLSLLSTLGLLPSLTRSSVSMAPLPHDATVFSPARGGFCTREEDASGLRLSPALSRFLHKAPMSSFEHLEPLEPSVLAELERLRAQLLGSQLGISLSSPAVRRSISSFVTPSCQVSARAS